MTPDDWGVMSSSVFDAAVVVVLPMKFGSIAVVTWMRCNVSPLPSSAEPTKQMQQQQFDVVTV